MRRVIVRFLAILGGLTLLACVLLGVAVSRMSKPKAVPAHIILELNLETEVSEDAGTSPLLALTGSQRPSLRGLVETLGRAAEDPRVVGLVARLGQHKMGLAQTQELRDAVRNFANKGKFTLAFSETFGEGGPANGSYYLATAFGEIWLQPSGDVGLSGLSLESMFVRGALDKLGVKPQMSQRYEYKNAMNMFTETKFTPAHREALERVGVSMQDQMIRGIAEGRKLSEEAVRGLFDGGPHLGADALKQKLVDKLGYRDEFMTEVRSRANGATLLYLQKYGERTQKAADGKVASAPKLALIYGVGQVQRGKSDVDPMSGSTSLGSATVAAAFRAAVADKDIKAIVFRIDSPGGSYVASDTVWREVGRARAQGKPVIATMGNVAGSGGYFVAMGADKIVAQPGTITGSIGVLSGKFVTTELMAGKLGLTHDRIELAKHAGMWSMNREFTPEEQALLDKSLDRVYEDFTKKAAEGRKLPLDRLKESAKGRIWTGEDAKKLGLVDELGGIERAVALAKQAAGIAEGQVVHIKKFPEEKDLPAMLLAQLKQEEGESSESASSEGGVGLRLRLSSVLELFRAMWHAETQAQTQILSSVPLGVE